MKANDHHREASHGRRMLVRFLRTAGYLFFVYATTYFLVMNTWEPAFPVGTLYPPAAKAVYDSSYLFWPWEQSPSGMTIFYPVPCWANRVFWPMDCLVQPWLKPCNKVVYDSQLQNHKSGR
jgi:hypothetical protein